MDPKEAAPYNNLGNTYREARGQLDEAEKSYRKAVALAPDEADSYNGLGLVFLARGNLAQAEKMFRCDA